MKELLHKVRESALAMALLKTEDKNDALERFAQLIEKRSADLLAANKLDLEEQKGKISEALYSRLKLDESKLKTLAQGCRDLIDLEDLVGKIQFRRELDKGLVLERVVVPIGVIGIIFESRPDVIPQILSLILKSGNAAILKGGVEAAHSNKEFMKLVDELNREFTFFPREWALLLDTRAQVHEMLKYEKEIDLVIPRGSNEMVRSIRSSTKIPVLGHSDGVCHLYVHENADIKQAVDIAVDAKAQYPSACNSIETLLVDESISEKFLLDFAKKAEQSKIVLIGCEKTRKILPQVKVATEADWSTEYGDLRLSIRVVKNLEDGIDHINTYGSHHTDAILTNNEFVMEIFLNAIDSACVFANASTRFADGFRFGFGAEVGISTEKIHARGPVGLEGLMSYKYKLRGHGQRVSDYVGPQAKVFTHKMLKI